MGLADMNRRQREGESRCCQLRQWEPCLWQSSNPNSNPVKGSTCKRFGRRKVTDAIAMEKHGNRVSKGSVAYCSVDEEMYLPG